MTHLLHIQDQGQGKIAIAWQRLGQVPRSCPQAVPFENRLSDNDRQDLRWYLERFLHFPYGADVDRALDVEQRMAQWGEVLFEQAFPKLDVDPDPRSLYQEAVRAGLSGCELAISSDDPAFLTVPWELIRDPQPGRGYLAPLLGGLYRHHPGIASKAMPPISPDQPFRILWVIARPGGVDDIDLGMMARPVLEALRSFRPQIQLHLLRPPTFHALSRCLDQHRGQYQLVHFDGHGNFLPGSRAPRRWYGPAVGQGVLVFENPDGSADRVSADKLGKLLADCQVPLFVLNACRSGQLGERDPFSSVASQVLAAGAQGVLAMSYAVWATTAARFVERFYEVLLQRQALSAAVAAARKHILAEAEHDTLKGPLELRDWMVPVLYQQQHAYVPIPDIKWQPPAEDEQQVALRKRVEQVCPEGRFGFVGRDDDILRIERALRDDQTPWVLLSGIGGVGKTALACGFARWYAETGGCPGGTFRASFKESASFATVVGSIAGFGTQFSILPEERQRDVLLKYLRENPCLLVWDNFEPVAGYPPGSPPLASQEDRDKLARFLRALRGGMSRVLITSRNGQEDWLGIPCQRVELQGLSPYDSKTLANAILRTVGRDPKEFGPGYKQLLDLLAGHPFSLEMVLPQLPDRTPEQVIADLQQRIGALGDALDASLEYAFTHLSAEAQQHLPYLALFASYADANTLGGFVQHAVRHAAQTHDTPLARAPDRAGWQRLLDEASQAGLVRPLPGGPAYELHPTLPTFLRHYLSQALGEEGIAKLDHEFVRFYAAFSAHVEQDLRRFEQVALGRMHFEEANLRRALRLSQASDRWAQGQAIVRALQAFYEARGRIAEWRALRSDLLAWTGRGAPSPQADPAQAHLWMFLLGLEANDALAAGEFVQSEEAHLAIVVHLEAMQDPQAEPNIATGYHQLGRVAEERGQLDLAEARYHKALEIRERLGLEREAASDYHQLGSIAYLRGRLERAEAWYRKALPIYERLGLEREVATIYHQLGVVAQRRGQYDRAEAWYGKALAIKERLGLERQAADEYGQLGNLAAKRRNLEQAEAQYRKALHIFERLGPKRRAAATYTNLGMVAQQRGRLEQAEAWYRRALEIKERLGLQRDAAADYHQLGSLAQQRAQFKQAEAWYRKALQIFERLGHPPQQVSTLARLGLLRHDQGQLGDAVSWSARALVMALKHRLPATAQILLDLGRLLHEMGEQPFAAAWRRATDGQEPPLDEIRRAMGQE